MSTIITSCIKEMCFPNANSADLNSKLSLLIPLDFVATITCLVIGILGVVGRLHMPIPVTYSLLGVGGAISLTWIMYMLKQCCSSE